MQKKSVLRDRQRHVMLCVQCVCCQRERGVRRQEKIINRAGTMVLAGMTRVESVLLCSIVNQLDGRVYCLCLGIVLPLRNISISI